MGFLRNVYYLLPPGTRRFARRIWFMPTDLADRMSGKRDPMIPPKGKIFIGSGDFQKTGEMLRNQLVDLAGLKPHYRVLDVGCGMGRLAVPLVSYLDENGSYEGFDIVKSAIVWCKRRIGAKDSRFNFTHIDLRNDLYNLSTQQEARHFQFPYGSGEFDLVCLTSVFTHMVLEDVENYLDQIQRILKPGGVCFATFFLMNQKGSSEPDIQGSLNFKVKRDHHYLLSDKVKEANVAFDEPYLLETMLKTRGFRVEQVYYGFWSGRSRSELGNFQDIVVFQKS